jgi:hypothetical protein
VQAHPLAKWQLAILIWFSVYYFIESIEGKPSPGVLVEVLVLIFIPLFALSVVTFWIGWLQLYKHEVIFYPFEEYRFRISRRLGGVKTLEEYKANQEKPYILKKTGSLNLVFGTLCALFVIFFSYVAISAMISRWN